MDHNSDTKLPRLDAAGLSARTRVTISVPEAGRRLGIGRNQAYEAAARGEIPTLRFGKKRLVVPLAAFEQMLQCK